VSGPGRRWFEQRKEFVAQKRSAAASDVPELFTRCPACHEPIFNEDLEENANVCPLCGHHFRVDASTRIALLCDPGTAIEQHDGHLISADPLQFVDSKPYHRRIEASRKNAAHNDAFLSASGVIAGVPVEVGSFEFGFMGGSMGSVVGEAITRLFERAAERRRPAIVVSASGGARMQEGVLSLMQMAKTCAALARLHDEAQMPYISVLTHPTTGGVAASFAMLGDVILAEPEALIGFAGPRVIEQTIGESLPEGFQTSEYLLAHGMIDRIVSRLDLRHEMGTLLRQLLGLDPLSATLREVTDLADGDAEL
jgi:acetyl-CoA carboxylase carboxyl transferase subunit beta